MKPVDDAPEVLIVEARDLRVRGLLAEGWRVAGESWGAQLVVDEEHLGACRRVVDAVEETGVRVGELGPQWASRLWTLELANHADYPVTPATTRPKLSLDDCQSLWTKGFRLFGATDGEELLAVTVVRQEESHGETEFTSVRADARRRGLAKAVKPASVLALAADGCSVFGTGGAQVNAASRAMNAALGYRVTERWFSLVR